MTEKTIQELLALSAELKPKVDEALKESSKVEKQLRKAVTPLAQARSVLFAKKIQELLTAEEEFWRKQGLTLERVQGQTPNGVFSSPTAIQHGMRLAVEVKSLYIPFDGIKAEVP